MVSPRVYRLRQLASKKDRHGVLPVGTATIWRWVRAGVFPAPFKLAPGTTVWDAEAVDAFIETRRCAAPDIKALKAKVTAPSFPTGKDGHGGRVEA